MVEVESGRVVSNDYGSIVRDFLTQWGEFTPTAAPDLFPSHLAGEMEEINKFLFTEINNGVYRSGFAGSQSAHQAAYERLWKALDWVEDRLGTQRYMVGEHLTETDIRLFVTLIRFDPVYYSHFKCSRQKLSEMPNIRGYLQELFQLPGFGDTTDFVEIKEHYFVVHEEINPTQIIPVGPDMSWLAQDHDRDRFGGQPFAAGTTAPAKLKSSEVVKNPLPFQTELFG